MQRNDGMTYANAGILQSEMTPHIEDREREGWACYPSAPKNPYFTLPGEANQPPVHYHLKNFLSAVRGQEPLNCDGATAYETEKVCQAIHNSCLNGEPVSLS